MMTGNEFSKKSYEYAVGAIKATSHPPLTEEEFKRLRESDLKGFSRLLDEFSWGRGIEGTIPERINGEFEYAVSFIKELSPDKELTDLLFFEYDAENLKLFLKGRLLGRDVSDMTNKNGAYPIEILRASVEAGDFSLIGEDADIELQGILDETDPFVISSKADRAIFIHTLFVAQKKSPLLYEMLLKYGEAKNRISEVRLRKLGLDSSLLLPLPFRSIENDPQKSDEEIIKEAQSDIARAMWDLRSGENFAPIAEYFFAKKNEAGMLRLILAECELKEAKKDE